MAITFSTDITEDRLLMAYNNNVVRFSSDSDITPLNCEVSGLGINALLQPKPDSTFFIDLKDYINSEANTRRFEDTLVTDLQDGDSDTFTYDVSDGTFIGGVITFRINFVDTSFETITRNVNFITGVVQLEDWKRQEIPSTTKYAVLSPVQKRSNNLVDLKYWEGYPFEISLYTTLPDNPFTVRNLSNGIDYEFMSKGRVTSLWLSDGRTDVTLEDFLPLVEGTNELKIVSEGETQDVSIFLNKVDSECGVYVKWRNSLGRWNYWLLNKTSFTDRSSKYNAELNADYDNLDETFAPTIQTGKTGNDVMKCNVKKLTKAEKDVFVGIIESPKIYLFVGERFSRSSFNDWIEISLRTSTLRVSDNKKVFSYNIDLELPTRYAQTL